MAVAKPTLVIPSGFEQQQNAAALKHKLATAMLEQGLKSRNDYTSWAQVLGQLSQAWAGKSLEKDAGKADAATNAAILQAYQAKRAAFQDAVNKGMDPKLVVQQFGNDPMLAEDVKPYAAAMQAGMTRQAENFAGKPFDPNSAVIEDGKGGFAVNPLKVTATRAGGGFDTTGFPTSMQMPGRGTPPPAMSSAEDPRARLAAAMADGTALLPKDTSIPFGNPLDPNLAQQSVPPPTHFTKDGRPAWYINGQFYDNPEGR